MASNNRLYRNFIILQEDERGYASSIDKTLSGYSKIESRGDKCKIAFYAQNLKREEVDNYHMVLICCKRDCKQLIDLGPITVNENGKGEMAKEFNSMDIGGLGVAFDKVSGAAIVKIKDEVCIYVMYGFLNGEDTKENWKHYHMVKASENRQKQNDRASKNNIKKDIKPKEVKEVRNSKIENHEKSYEVPYEEVGGKEYVKIKVESTGEDVYAPKESIRGKFDDYEEKINIIKGFDPNISKIKGSIGEYFENIAEGFDVIKDKYKEVKYTKWYKVPAKDINQMCNSSNYNKYTLAYYPMINYYPYIKKNGCFNIGYKCDENGTLKYIIYGIHGKKDKDEQPYDGKTGFVTWIKDDDSDDMGCWLMFYDFRNSTVVVPME